VVVPAVVVSDAVRSGRVGPRASSWGRHRPGRDTQQGENGTATRQGEAEKAKDGPDPEAARGAELAVQKLRPRDSFGPGDVQESTESDGDVHVEQHEEEERQCQVPVRRAAAGT